MTHANFEIIDANEHRLVIRDLGPWNQFPTITNDAEYVVEQIAKTLGERTLLYVDSEGTTDELVVRDGKFFGFQCWKGRQY